MPTCEHVPYFWQFYLLLHKVLYGKAVPICHSTPPLPEARPVLKKMRTTTVQKPHAGWVGVKQSKGKSTQVSFPKWRDLHMAFLFFSFSAFTYAIFLCMHIIYPYQYVLCILVLLKMQPVNWQAWSVRQIQEHIYDGYFVWRGALTPSPTLISWSAN